MELGYFHISCAFVFQRLLCSLDFMRCNALYVPLKFLPSVVSAQEVVLK